MNFVLLSCVLIRTYASNLCPLEVVDHPNITISASMVNTYEQYTKHTMTDTVGYTST